MQGAESSKAVAGVKESTFGTANQGYLVLEFPGERRLTQLRHARNAMCVLCIPPFWIGTASVMRLQRVPVG
jgi:hypothetical protein